jgi:prevent-host-death family protein
MKRVSVAEAKNQLPALIHAADGEPVEILRRGKPVAVLVSTAAFARLQERAEGSWAALQRFRAAHALDGVEADGVFAGVRDKTSAGRPVRW